MNARVFNINNGAYSVSAAEGEFLGTLAIVGLSLTDSSGTPLDFTVSSLSGARYTSAGITPVPEPATCASGVAGIGLLALMRSARKRRSS